MKYLITNRQYNLIKENNELSFPFAIFNNDWDLVLSAMKGRPFHIQGSLNLYKSGVKSLGNLQSVEGDLNLTAAQITSLGNLQYVGHTLSLYKSNIKSLGHLISVGGDLDLFSTRIESLGNLQSVGGDLDLQHTPLSEEYFEDQIRRMVDVKREIYI